jgi:hypothetical protein
VITIRLDQPLLDAMDALQERDGIPYSEQVRRALLGFLDVKGFQVKTDPRRANRRQKL